MTAGVALSGGADVGDGSQLHMKSLLAAGWKNDAVMAAQLQVTELLQISLFDHKVFTITLEAVYSQILAHPLLAETALVALFNQFDCTMDMIRMHAMRLHYRHQIKAQRTHTLLAQLQLDLVLFTHFLNSPVEPPELEGRSCKLFLLMRRKIELGIVFWLSQTHIVNDESCNRQNNKPTEGRTQLNYEFHVGGSLLLPTVLDIRRRGH